MQKQVANSLSDGYREDAERCRRVAATLHESAQAVVIPAEPVNVGVAGVVHPLVLAQRRARASAIRRRDRLVKQAARASRDADKFDAMASAK